MGEWLESLVPWGTEVIVWTQSFSNEWLDAVFGFFTALGYELFYVLALSFIYWCVSRRIGASLGYVSMLSAWLNSVVKFMFKIPRPSDPRIRVLWPETSPSFPSGHAQNAVVNWGYMAIRFGNRFFWVVAVIAIVGISLSRIMLGVHYPQDVIGGALIGLALLAVYVWAEEPVIRWLADRGRGVQLLLAVAVPTVLIFLHPADAEGLYPAKDAVRPMALLVGFGIGLVMERAWVRFGVEGTWPRRGVRYVVGLVVVAVFYLAPTLVDPGEVTHGIETVLRYLRYTLMGWAGAFLCPWLFVVLRLAGRSADAG